jgi:hypothetical protein
LLEGGARVNTRRAQFLVLTIRIKQSSYVIVYLWASAQGRGEQRHRRAATASAARSPAVGFSTDLFLRCDIFRCDIVHSFYIGLLVIINTEKSVDIAHFFHPGLGVAPTSHGVEKLLKHGSLDWVSPDNKNVWNSVLQKSTFKP